MSLLSKDVVFNIFTHYTVLLIGHFYFNFLMEYLLKSLPPSSYKLFRPPTTHTQTHTEKKLLCHP